MLVFNLPAFENKKYKAYDSLYGKIPNKKEPIRTLRFTSRLPCHIIKCMKLIYYLNYVFLCLSITHELGSPKAN